MLMKTLAIFFFVISALLAIGGLINSSKPSVFPIITVIGSFVLPALFAWWGVISWKRSDSKRRDPE